MEQCKAANKNGTRCRRKASNGSFCMQHARGDRGGRRVFIGKEA